MTISSIALSNITVGPLIEACFQNLAAGLIIAAGFWHNIVDIVVELYAN